MAVRSAVLGRYTSVAGANQVVTTVPAGYTVLVKNISISNRSGSNATCVVYARAPSVTTQVDIVNASITAGPAPTQWNGWIVIPPGGTITCYSDKAGVDFWISGSELVGTQPFG